MLGSALASPQVLPRRHSHGGRVWSAGLIRFGVLELDRRSGELRKTGVRINLQEQALQVLTLLLERPGDLVTRDELRQRLSPTGTSGDFDHGLNAVINRLRDTLGDSADSPRFIETLPRRGYRFIGPVDGHRPIEQSGSNEAAAAQADGQPTDIPPATALPVLNQPLERLGSDVSPAVGWRLRPAPVVEASLRVVPLTTLKGWEGHPTFSPDGTQIAFTWSGKEGDEPLGLEQVGHVREDHRVSGRASSDHELSRARVPARGGNSVRLLGLAS